MFNKLFTKILDSSIWLEPDSTRIVWFTLLAAMDEDGYAHFSAIENLASRARVSVEAAKAAIDCFLSPDPNSSNPDNEGRRVERIPGGFLVLNARYYRDILNRVTQREKTRQRVKIHRFKKKLKQSCNASSMEPVGIVKDSNEDSNQKKREAEAEAEAEALKKRGASSKRLKCNDQIMIPEPLQTEAFKSTWNSWLSHLAEKRKKPSSLARAMQLKKLSSWGEARAISAINHSISNNWIGIYEDQNHGNQNRRGYTKGNHRNEGIIANHDYTASDQERLDRANRMAEEMAAARCLPSPEGGGHEPGNGTPVPPYLRQP